MFSRVNRFAFSGLTCLAVALAASGQPRPTIPPVVDKAVEPVIPAPRAEPVVPPSPARSIAAELNDAFVNVFDRVAPAVVIIDVYKRGGSSDGPEYFPEFFFETPEESHDGKSPSPAPKKTDLRSESEGSGFIIESGGYILTNNHVVDGATSITVRLKDGRQFPGKLVGADEKSDVAMIKIAAADLPTAELADSDAARVGEIVCAIGVPYKLDYTFTTGVVSAKGRTTLRVAQDDYEDYIQTDASINPGNSGGPLVNLDGKVIGMNTLIHGFNRGLGFSIPSNILRNIGDQLIRLGHVVRSYIGVRIESLDDNEQHYGAVFSALKKGVIVKSVLPDSPAMKNDALQPADVILNVDGVPVNSDQELQKQILSKKVGAIVQMDVLRHRKAIKTSVVTEELPTPVASTEPETAETAGDQSAEAVRKEKAAQFYGLKVQELTREVAANAGVRAASGILVNSIAPDSLAEKADFKVNDVITAVDDRPVKDLAAFRDAMKASDSRKGILCVVDRLLSSTFLVIKEQ